MRNRILIALVVLFLFGKVLFHAQHACGENDLPLGEVSFYGDVFIRSSTGNLMPAPSSYPILPNTEIRTEKGSASLYYKDGTRIDLPESTTAVVDGTNSNYTVHLAKGKVLVNSSSTASMTISHGSTDILINSDRGIVPASGAHRGDRFLGTVSSENGGLSVRSMSGKALVKVSASEPKILTGGKGMFIGSDSRESVYSHSQSGFHHKKCHEHKHHKKHASPYYFDDDDFDVCSSDDDRDQDDD
jgi:hypothetical protein